MNYNYSDQIFEKKSTKPIGLIIQHFIILCLDIKYNTN